MRNRTVVVVVMVMSMVMVEACFGWEEMVSVATEKAKVGAEEAKQRAEESVQNAIDWTASWSNCASNKFSANKEETKQAAKTVMDRARDAMASDRAGYAKDVAYDRASHPKDLAYDKAGRVIRMATDGINEFKDKAYDAYEQGSLSAGDVDKRCDDAKEEMKRSMQYAKTGDHGKEEEAAEAFDEAMKKVGEKHIEAKDKYEYAKEKASQATGDLGERMRQDRAEL